MFKILSILLSYPRQEWLDHTEEMYSTLSSYLSTSQIVALQPFFEYLHTHDEIELQEV